MDLTLVTYSSEPNLTIRSSHIHTRGLSWKRYYVPMSGNGSRSTWRKQNRVVSGMSRFFHFGQGIWLIHIPIQNQNIRRTDRGWYPMHSGPRLCSGLCHGQCGFCSRWFRSCSRKRRLDQCCWQQSNSNYRQGCQQTILCTGWEVIIHVF